MRVFANCGIVYLLSKLESHFDRRLGRGPRARPQTEIDFSEEHPGADTPCRGAKESGP